MLDVEIIKTASGWYNENWYDPDTESLVEALEEWRYDTESMESTLKVLKTLRTIRYTRENDYAYNVLKLADNFLVDHLLSLS